MITIWDAIDAARERNMMRDQQNAAARMPVQAPQVPLIPVPQQNGGGGGDGGAQNQYQDTRNQHQKYQDAVRFNSQVAPMLGIAGMGMAALNDKMIKDYEERFPTFAATGPRFSRFGTTPERGYPQNAFVPSLFERIFSGSPVQETTMPTLFTHQGATFTGRGSDGSDGGNQGGGGFSSTAEGHSMGAAANPGRDDGGWGL